MKMNKAIYRQYDSRWGDLPYPGKGACLSDSGCGCLAVLHCAIELDAYKNMLPPECRKYMVQFATVANGTLWSGITEGLKHYGFKVHWKESDSMQDVFRELENSLKCGVILFAKKNGASYGPDGTLWTTIGHYIAFTDYKIENGKHYFYMKDSGSRKHDGWYCFEKSMKGCCRNVWICKSASGKKADPEPDPEPQPAPEPRPEKYPGNYPSVKKYLEPGDRGENVIRLQQYLDWYYNGAFFKECGPADGIYGKNTLKWTNKMLTEFFGAAEADGKVGPKTIAEMKRRGGANEPDDKTKVSTVIDVSYVQKSINWTKVKAAGVKGAIIRCGFRGYESAKLQEDNMFMSHIKGAHAAGLKIGVYFFTEAINAKEGKEEADYAVKLIEKAGVPLDYPVAVDTEYINAKNVRANGLSRAKRTEVIKAFCEEIKALGYTPMIYGSTSWLNNQLDMSKLPYKVWCAQYYKECQYKGSYIFWQYTSEGKIDGIKGVVDLNKCYI